LTDLAVKLVGLGFSLLFGFMVLSKMSGAPSSICRFQVETIVGMDTEPTGNLSGCFIVLNRRERDLRFELWTVHFSLFTHRQILL
jgi:hypothetical protein